SRSRTCRSGRSRSRKTTGRRERVAARLAAASDTRSLGGSSTTLRPTKFPRSSESGEVTRLGTALPSALRPRRRASSRVVPNPRGSRGSGGRTRGPPRIRREPGRAAGRRGKGRPPFPRAPGGIPRTSARPSCRLPSSLHVNVNATVLKADREGVSFLDFRRPGDDVPVLPFRDGVSALQRRERTQQVQAAADGGEVLPASEDLARAESGQDFLHAVEAFAIRFDASPQPARRHSFP